MSKNKITNVIGRMVFDSRGNPAVEAEIEINKNYYAKAISPSGASKGKNEALEKRDNDNTRFCGMSVDQNISIINKEIKETLMGLDIEDQMMIDKNLIALDGTLNKSNIGGNTTIAVSMATLRGAAVSNKKPL